MVQTVWASIMSLVGGIVVVLLGYIIYQLKKVGEKIDLSMTEVHCLEHRNTCKVSYDREIKTIKDDFKYHSHNGNGRVVIGGSK